ncbi:MAG: hypothetical protein JKY23_05920 [Nitrospinaceae bacterium]|nr:hypothetical protein [Nitrospinaceae bacterium]
MIEQYLQVALEFVKEIWFQLDSQFGLEETEASKFIQPYLLQLQDNPTYMGIAFAALVLIPFGLYKVRSISRERERKLDDLMEEMEEDELDEDDPSRLRRPVPAEEVETSTAEEDDEEDDKPLFEAEDDEPPPYMQILEKLDKEESDDELHVDTQKVMGANKDIEPVSSELAESQIDKDLSEFEGFEFDSDPIEKDSPHDLAIQELQEEGQLTEIDSALSPDDPFANYSELDDDEQDRAIQELQDEMESTINKLTEQLESTPETTPAIKDLGDIRIGDGATIDDEFTLDEEFSLDEDFSTEEPPNVSEPEPLSLEALDLTEEVEPAIESIEPVIEEIEPKMPPLQPVPERDYTVDDKPDRQVDSLINRLKYFQENLDTRFHHDEKRELPFVPKTVDLAEEHRFVEQQSFTTKKAPVDNKKYMEVLESFIFLKDQNKH